MSGEPKHILRHAFVPPIGPDPNNARYSYQRWQEQDGYNHCESCGLHRTSEAHHVIESADEYWRRVMPLGVSTQSQDELHQKVAELRYDWPWRNAEGVCPDCGVGPEGWGTNCRACIARRLATTDR